MASKMLYTETIGYNANDQEPGLHQYGFCKLSDVETHEENQAGRCLRRYWVGNDCYRVAITDPLYDVPFSQWTESQRWWRMNDEKKMNYSLQVNDINGASMLMEAVARQAYKDWCSNPHGQEGVSALRWAAEITGSDVEDIEIAWKRKKEAESKPKKQEVKAKKSGFKVISFTLDGMPDLIFDSAKEAADYYGIPSSNVVNCCREKYRRCTTKAKRIFRYADKWDGNPIDVKPVKRESIVVSDNTLKRVVEKKQTEQKPKGKAGRPRVSEEHRKALRSANRKRYYEAHREQILEYHREYQRTRAKKYRDMTEEQKQIRREINRRYKERQKAKMEEAKNGEK